MFRNKKRIAGVALAAVLVASMFAAFVPHEMAKAAAPISADSKAAIVGKIAIPSSVTYPAGRTLTVICGRDRAFLFKGFVTFDSGNSGTNYVKATLTGATDVTCAAGQSFPCTAINSDTMLINGAATDYLIIVGEEIKEAHGGTYE